MTSGPLPHYLHIDPVNKTKMKKISNKKEISTDYFMRKLIQMGIVPRQTWVKQDVPHYVYFIAGKVVNPRRRFPTLS